ncbi:TolC family protein [Ramlibacter sp. MAHUQ-53]|uniref:TolC family protein n=1 Tax=unclassified Ramlibacter TaxID=2617605 RepID=UPI00363FEB55
MHRLSLFLLSALLAAGLAHGQPAAAPADASSPLTLAQVLQAARDNLDVSLARRALAGAQADVVAADRRPTPVLSAKAGSMDLEHGIGPGNALREKRIDKGLGLDWTVERGDKRALRTRAAERNAQAARLELAEVLVQQQAAAAAAYYDLLAAQERVGQVEALARSAADLAAAAQRRLRAGDLSQQDALRTEIEARRAQAELRGAQADRQRAVLALAQVTGLRGDLRAEVAWPAAGPLAGDGPDIEQRPAVLAARERVQAAQAAYDGALALRRNDVTVGASVDHIPGTSRRQLELRLQMPLAGVLGTYGYEGEIARARAALEQAQDQLEMARRDALADTGRLREDLRAAAARAADFQSDIVPRARQVAAMAELAYTRGALSLTDLVEARRTLRAVLVDELAARAEHARAASAWQLRLAPPTN